MREYVLQSDEFLVSKTNEEGNVLFADEVRKLAERTQKSLTETMTTTNVLIQSIYESSDILNKNAEFVNDISGEVGTVSNKMDQIINTLKSVTR